MNNLILSIKFGIKEKMKNNTKEVKIKKTISKRKNQNEPLKKNFTKVLITEKDYLNTSQKIFFNNPKIKIGQR